MHGGFLKVILAAAILAVTLNTALAADKPRNTPPPGFHNLFNGQNLGGWSGREPNLDPEKFAKMPGDVQNKKREEWNKDRDVNWRVDVPKGELVSTGHGVHLVSDGHYRDFEFRVDWLMVSPNGDSGIYLRNTPQIQIWDPENPREVGNGAPKGSGGLWNNKKNAQGRFPLVKADNPIGQWNTFHIKMVGDRVWVWLNDKLTVDGCPFDNYFDAAKPLAVRGPIELQTHGSEMRFRNIYIRPLNTDEANELLQKAAGEGYKSIFNGRDFEGWAGATDNYIVENAAIACRPGKGGTVFTKQEYGDFEAILEFKLPPGGNNGLAIRYPGGNGHADTAYYGMCELQILDDTAGQYGSLDPRQYCGSIYGVAAAQRGFLRPVGAWNFERIIIKGHRITVELNGTVITDADVSTIKEFMGNKPHPGLLRDKGSFGFAGHNDPVEFRNIHIKPLN